MTTDDDLVHVTIANDGVVRSGARISAVADLRG